jgi:hypothetical protein
VSVYLVFARLLDPRLYERDRHDNLPVRAGVGHPFWSAAAIFPESAEERMPALCPDFLIETLS